MKKLLLTLLVCSISYSALAQTESTPQKKESKSQIVKLLSSYNEFSKIERYVTNINVKSIKSYIVILTNVTNNQKNGGLVISSSGLSPEKFIIDYDEITDFINVLEHIKKELSTTPTVETEYYFITNDNIIVNAIYTNKWNTNPMWYVKMYLNTEIKLIDKIDQFISLLKEAKSKIDECIK